MTEARDAKAVEQIRETLGSREDRSRTHWAGCETDPRHRDCALRVVLRAHDRLRVVCEESNDACICGCPLEEHDNYGEDGEACQDPTHECLRTSKAVYAHLATLRAEHDRLRAAWQQAEESDSRNSKARIAAELRAENAESSVEALRQALEEMAKMWQQAAHGGILASNSLRERGAYEDGAYERGKADARRFCAESLLAALALPGEAAQETQK